MRHVGYLTCEECKTNWFEIIKSLRIGGLRPPISVILPVLMGFLEARPSPRSGEHRYNWFPPTATFRYADCAGTLGGRQARTGGLVNRFSGDPNVLCFDCGLPSQLIWIPLS
jgi:hypothetical protein